MSGFRTGQFNREQLSPFLRRFCPKQAVTSILEIHANDLVEGGKKLIMLDVDNTLLVWRSEDIPETTVKWIESMRSAGMQMCILSNTRNPGRLDRLAKTMGIPYYLGKFKPSTEMYERALQEFGVSADEAIMIGDQMFTDILGANRTGIDAIWVKQMAPVDFIGTKVSRLGERILRPRLYRAIMEEPGGDPDADLPVGGTAAFAMLSNPTVRQFIKFCIIGGTSMVVDLGIFYLLMFVVPLGGSLMSERLGAWLVEQSSIFTSLATRDGVFDAKLACVPFFKPISAGVAILNSFLWNRRWTFRIRGREHRSVQLRKFFAVALIGLLLNTIITTGLGNVIPGHPKRSLFVGQLIATVVVAFWNFFGQKLWTFRGAKTH